MKASLTEKLTVHYFSHIVYYDIVIPSVSSLLWQVGAHKTNSEHNYKSQNVIPQHPHTSHLTLRASHWSILSQHLPLIGCHIVLRTLSLVSSFVTVSSVSRSQPRSCPANHLAKLWSCWSQDYSLYIEIFELAMDECIYEITECVWYFAGLDCLVSRLIWG